MKAPQKQRVKGQRAQDAAQRGEEDKTTSSTTPPPSRPELGIGETEQSPLGNAELGDMSSEEDHSSALWAELREELDFLATGTDDPSFFDDLDDIDLEGQHCLVASVAAKLGFCLDLRGRTSAELESLAEKARWQWILSMDLTFDDDYTQDLKYYHERFGEALSAVPIDCWLDSDIQEAIAARLAAQDSDKPKGKKNKKRKKNPEKRPLAVPSPVKGVAAAAPPAVSAPHVESVVEELRSGSSSPSAAATAARDARLCGEPLPGSSPCCSAARAADEEQEDSLEDRSGAAHYKVPSRSDLVEWDLASYNKGGPRSGSLPKCENGPIRFCISDGSCASRTHSTADEDDLRFLLATQTAKLATALDRIAALESEVMRVRQRLPLATGATAVAEVQTEHETEDALKLTNRTTTSEPISACSQVALADARWMRSSTSPRLLRAGCPAGPLSAGVDAPAGAKAADAPAVLADCDQLVVDRYSAQHNKKKKRNKPEQISPPRLFQAAAPTLVSNPERMGEASVCCVGESEHVEGHDGGAAEAPAASASAAAMREEHSDGEGGPAGVVDFGSGASPGAGDGAPACGADTSPRGTECEGDGGFISRSHPGWAWGINCPMAYMMPVATLLMPYYGFQHTPPQQNGDTSFGHPAFGGVAAAAVPAASACAAGGPPFALRRSRSAPAGTSFYFDALDHEGQSPFRGPVLR